MLLSFFCSKYNTTIGKIIANMYFIICNIIPIDILKFISKKLIAIPMASKLINLYTLCYFS